MRVKRSNWSATKFLVVIYYSTYKHFVIHFRYGGVEAALFVLLTTLNKQLEFEQSADIYMFAKLLYMKRPGVFRSKVSLPPPS